jgi:hypothetical protein
MRRLCSITGRDLSIFNLLSFKSHTKSGIESSWLVLLKLSVLKETCFVITLPILFSAPALIEDCLYKLCYIIQITWLLAFPRLGLFHSLLSTLLPTPEQNYCNHINILWNLLTLQSSLKFAVDGFKTVQILKYTCICCVSCLHALNFLWHLKYLVKSYLSSRPGSHTLLYLQNLYWALK